MAVNNDLGSLLAEHPFFAGMVPAVQQILVGCARNERFDAGDYVHRAGESADRFYLIRHGSLALELQVLGRSPIVLDTVDVGEVSGWSWLVPPYQWTMDARATSLVRAVSLDAVCLRGKCESDHELGYALYQRFIPVMGRRLYAARRRLLDVYGAPR